MAAYTLFNPRRIAFLILVVLFCSIAIPAQEQGQYDKGTPPQHVAGVSALGSYTSAELGTGCSTRLAS